MDRLRRRSGDHERYPTQDIHALNPYDPPQPTKGRIDSPVMRNACPVCTTPQNGWRLWMLGTQCDVCKTTLMIQIPRWMQVAMSIGVCILIIVGYLWLSRHPGFLIEHARAFIIAPVLLIPIQIGVLAAFGYPAPRRGWRTCSNDEVRALREAYIATQTGPKSGYGLRIRETDNPVAADDSEPLQR